MAYSSNAPYRPSRRDQNGYESGQAQYAQPNRAQNRYYDHAQQTYGPGNDGRVDYDHGYEQQYEQYNEYEDDGYAQRSPPPQQNAVYYGDQQHRDPVIQPQQRSYQQQWPPPQSQAVYSDPSQQVSRREDAHGRNGPDQQNYQQYWPSSAPQASHGEYRQERGRRGDPEGQRGHEHNRRYDPRYQQRSEGGRHANEATQQPQQPSRPIHAPTDSYRSQRSEISPNAARKYQGDTRYEEPAYQRSAVDLPAPPRLWDPASERPQSAPGPDRGVATAKTKMADWKAAERAKMNAVGPETLPQDNAFPTFPTKRERSKAPTDRTGAASEMTNRTSVEQARPSTSSGHRNEKTVGASRHDSPMGQQAVSRPQLGEPTYSTDSMDRGRQQQYAIEQASPSLEVQPQFPREQADPTVRSAHERDQHYQQRPVQIPEPGADGQPGPYFPPENDPSIQQYHQDVARLQWEQAPSQQQQRVQRKPLTSRAPAPQSIDTRQPIKQYGQIFAEHQALSPQIVSQMSPLVQGQQSPVGREVTSPVSVHSPHQVPYENIERQVSAASSNQPQFHHGTERGVYTQQYDGRQQLQSSGPPKDREEEIEAAMPDFDSAAPGGTSLLYKRSQHASPPVAELPSHAPPVAVGHSTQYPATYHRSPPVQQHHAPAQRYDTGQDIRYQARSPDHDQRNPSNSFVFELAGDNSREQQQYDRTYQIPTQQRYDTSDWQRPPQPTFTSERPRRSNDDARHGPYSQGQPPTRGIQPDARPPHDAQYRPRQHPNMGGKFSGQAIPTPRYVPGEEQVSSAPPTRQAFQQPPPQQRPMPIGAPLTQQRSAPDQFGQRQPGHRYNNSNPDSLPQHPVPVRPGLVGGTMTSKSLPARQYDGAVASQPDSRRSIERSKPEPVTKAELEQLRAAVEAQPENQKKTLLLVKKLAEAADVLSSEGGRAERQVVIKNREKYTNDAYRRLKKLVSNNYAEAQFYLADCYGQGTLGLEIDAKEAFKLYQAAAKAGHPQAAYRTAMCCELGAEDGGGASKDYGKAVQWYRRGAALGDPDAMFKIGIILLRGLLGQQRNVGEAVNFLKRAAERAGADNPHALYELAALYETSNTNPELRNRVLADDRYALELYQRAAATGHRGAQFRLGQAYEYASLGVTIDNRASIAWYTKAAAQGEHNAELALSGWYLTGAEGILEHSDTEAYLWARKAASSEPPLAKAMFAMGYFTETGIGCPANLEEAKRWYGRAAGEYSTLPCDEACVNWEGDTLTCV